MPRVKIDRRQVEKNPGSFEEAGVLAGRILNSQPEG